MQQNQAYGEGSSAENVNARNTLKPRADRKPLAPVQITNLVPPAKPIVKAGPGASRNTTWLNAALCNGASQQQIFQKGAYKKQPIGTVSRAQNPAFEVFDEGKKDVVAEAKPQQEDDCKKAEVSKEDCEAEKENLFGERKASIGVRSQERAPLAPIAAFEDLEMRSIAAESPMLLDASIASITSTHAAEFDAYFVCAEYADDIYAYMRECETRFRPRARYMQRQVDITHSMRSVLVDWLCEVAEEYSLNTETYFLAVSYIDRFLSSMEVMRPKLQLVGTAAMYIASKYEEIYPPEVGEFVYITDDTYSKSQVLRMEQLVLKVLSFDLSAPTTYDFLRRFTSAIGASPRVQHLAQYLCELTLLEADPFLSFLPSVIAASSLAIANHTLGRIPWNEELEKISGYIEMDLRECTSALYRSYVKAPEYPQQAVREKFKSTKYTQVALLSPLPAPPF